jgi:hypothetical protein
MKLKNIVNNIIYKSFNVGDAFIFENGSKNISYEVLKKEDNRFLVNVFENDNFLYNCPNVGPDYLLDFIAKKIKQ